MPKRIVDLRTQTPLLNIVSYGRRAPGRHAARSKDEVAHALRTARRVPEVVVKVSGGARTVRGVQKHLDYIGREGELELEPDDGNRVQGRGFERALLDEWDLDLEATRRHTQRAIAAGRRPPKLVHNVVLSMPQGTPPKKLYEAARTFAREQFGLRHRYVMALHTDQGHPHVHVVVKAMSEDGVRLHITKPMLREWRREFARHLRAVGVEANATERAVRGATRTPKADGIHRAMLRGESTHYRERAESAARELATGAGRAESGQQALRRTRREVVEGWRGLAAQLDRDGMSEEARIVRDFVTTMPRPQTDREQIAERLRAKLPRTPVHQRTR